MLFNMFAVYLNMEKSEVETSVAADEGSQLNRNRVSIINYEYTSSI